MNVRRTVVAAWVLGFLVGQAGLQPAQAADGDLTHHALANGLQVYVIEKHTCPIASVQVWYRTGALNERPGIRGLSHLFEHMMFRGSENFGPEEHSKGIKRAGGSCNAYTNEDVTVYHEVVPVGAVDLVLKMEADRMARLKLDEKTLETEVEVVKEEYRVGVENDAMGRIMYDFARRYFGDHPYGYAVLGNMNDLDTVSVATCRAYYRARYAPNNAALIVSGDVEPDSVFAAAARCFGAIPSIPAIVPDPAPPPPPPRELEGRTDLPVPITGVVYRLPPVGDPDHLALELFTSILEKRLDWRLTRESSTCVYFESEWMPTRQSTVGLVMGAHLPSVPAERVIRAIDQEVQGYLADQLTQEELDRTRNPFLLAEARKRHRVADMAQDLGTALFVAEDLDRYTGRIAQISALTPQGVREAVRRHFTTENRTEVRITPLNTPLWLKVVSWVKTTLHV